MILVSKTYREATPESAEYGDYSDSGFDFEHVEYGFRELVRLLRDYPNASCYPATGSIFEWYSSNFEVIDYADGTEREESIHYSHKNKPYNARYWRLAAIAAGIVSSGATK